MKPATGYEPDKITIVNKRYCVFHFRWLNLVFFFICFSAKANIRLPQLVSSHMVLQRNIELKIWGWLRLVKK